MQNKTNFFRRKKEEFLSKVPGSFIELKSIDRYREKKKKKIRKNKSERNEMIHGRFLFLIYPRSIDSTRATRTIHSILS